MAASNKVLIVAGLFLLSFLLLRFWTPRLTINLSLDLDLDLDGFRLLEISANNNFTKEELRSLDAILKAAAFDNTVLVTPLNRAWASEGSMIDYLLESFRIGENTSHLLNNLVIVALDQVAYERCISIHHHCYALQTEGVDFSAEKVFMSEDYLKMTQRKISLLSLVLQMGYNFIFTDGDILWLRDPIPHFSSEPDFEVSCDYFNGNETDMSNSPNTGILHVKSNNRTIEMYKYWERSTQVYLNLHDQDVFNRIRFNEDFLAIGVNMRLLPTEIFGSFCQPVRSFDKVCTMHANCCKGLQAKLDDLRLVVEDWKRYLAQNSEVQTVDFHAPDACKRSWG